MSSVSGHSRSDSSVLTPLAYGATPGSIFSTINTSPDVLLVNETLQDMKASLANFEVCNTELGRAQRMITLTSIS